MARPKEFDKTDALLQAMRLFWLHGYEGASLTELLRVTGLSKSSLYDTFGNKRDLFLAAFEVYRTERMRTLHGYLTSRPTAYESIEEFFRILLQQANERPFGCMSCNEAVELGPHDAEVQQIIERDFQGIENALTEAVERGQADGSIPLHKNARKLGRYLTVSHVGLQVMARSRTGDDRLEDALDIILAGLK